MTEKYYGIAKGDICNRDGCTGVIDVEHEGDGCLCHLHPPCSYCVSELHYCPECNWEEVMNG